MTVDGAPVFAVDGLTVDFIAGRRSHRAVDGVSLAVRPGRTLGVVGESGAGKSVTMLAALRLLATPPARVRGAALLQGRDLLRLPRTELRRVRGQVVGMVFQDPQSSLHPAYRIGTQIAEAIRAHHPQTSRRVAHGRAVELLDRVGIPSALRRARDYPHEWSGGMRQRAMVALAIANRPALLVADEPTTALDVTVQAQVLDLLRDVQAEFGMALVLVTHDLGVVAEMADEVSVLHRGRVVEHGTADEVFHRPRAAHTVDLLAHRIRLDAPALTTAARATPGPGEPRGEPVLEARNLVRHFPARTGGRHRVVHAVDGVSLALYAGETLGLVGESGCGKSTLARTLVHLLPPTAGQVVFEGRDVTRLSRAELRTVRARLRIVFQDPLAALNPRRTVGDIVAEPLRIHRRCHGAELRDRVRQLLRQVAVPPQRADGYPHELSGGQRQRIGIARALALDPRVLVLDEPVSSLDAAVRGTILELLTTLQAQLGLSYLFISHDLAVVRQVSHRIAVMYLGRVVETGPAAALCARPAHPYTQALLSAVPVPDPAQRALHTRILAAGELPDPLAPPCGCRFRTRCWLVEERCAVQEPVLRGDDQRRCACHRVSPGGPPA